MKVSELIQRHTYNHSHIAEIRLNFCNETHFPYTCIFYYAQEEGPKVDKSKKKLHSARLDMDTAKSRYDMKISHDRFNFI